MGLNAQSYIQNVRNTLDRELKELNITEKQRAEVTDKVMTQLQPAITNFDRLVQALNSALKSPDQVGDGLNKRIVEIIKNANAGYLNKKGEPRHFVWT